MPLCSSNAVNCLNMSSVLFSSDRATNWPGDHCCGFSTCCASRLGKHERSLPRGDQASEMDDTEYREVLPAESPPQAGCVTRRHSLRLGRKFALATPTLLCPHHRISPARSSTALYYIENLLPLLARSQSGCSGNMHQAAAHVFREQGIRWQFFSPNGVQARDFDLQLIASRVLGGSSTQRRSHLELFLRDDVKRIGHVKAAEKELSCASRARSFRSGIIDLLAYLDGNGRDRFQEHRPPLPEHESPAVRQLTTYHARRSWRQNKPRFVYS